MIVDLFDALNHCKTTSPWIGIINIWLTNHSLLRGVNNRVRGRSETQKVRIGNYFAHPSRPTTPDLYPVAIYLSLRA